MTKKYIVKAKDVDGCDVLLGEIEWKNHMLERHPEIEPFLSEIKKAAAHPDERHIDPEDERVFLHYYRIPKTKKPHEKISYLLLVIKYVNAPERNFERTGFISSVYFVREIKRRGKRI